MPAAPHNCRFKGYNSKERQRGMRRKRKRRGRWNTVKAGWKRRPHGPLGFDALKGGKT